MLGGFPAGTLCKYAYVILASVKCKQLLVAN